MKIALVHDFLTQFGGAERVLNAIHEIWPDAPIYTTLANKQVLDQLRIPHLLIRQPKVLRFPLIYSFYKYFSLFYPLIFENFDLSEFDLVISSSANFAKGVITQPGQIHICYCHTPPRFLYQYPTETNRRGNWFWGPILKPLDNCLRIWDFQAAQRVDYFVTNSENTSKRIWKFYRRDAKVIYPPVELGTRYSVSGERLRKDDPLTENRKPQNHAVRGGPKTENYFLVVSRLSAYKRVELAIKACDCLRLPLKIVGTGPEEKRLKKIAGPTVEFLGFVSDKKLAEHYQNCQALIFPVEDEEFGIVPVEAMSFGKPVIAHRSGGVKETVIDLSTRSTSSGQAGSGQGATGVFFDEPTVESLIDVLRDFDASKFNPQDCIEQATKFSKERFQEEFRVFVEEKWEERVERE